MIKFIQQEASEKAQEIKLKADEERFRAREGEVAPPGGELIN